MRIHCLGDSITEGWGLEHPMEQSFPALLTKKGKNEYINFGSAGAALQSFLPNAYENTLAFQASQRHKADKTLILLGTNDAENLTSHFKDEYERLLDKIEGDKVLLIPPKTNHPQLNRKLEKIKADIEAIAKERQLPLIDLYTPSKEDWLSYDGIHPNAHGQEEIAKIVKQSTEK